MSFGLMRTSRRQALAVVAAGIVGCVCAQSVHAQDWPNRPVTIVVPYGPGASNDTFTRALALVLTKQFGQPFVVSNRPGAGGFIGSDAVAKAAPDGYTFLEMPSSIAGFKPIMKVDLDPLKNLAPIGLMARAPDAMVINAGLPVKTVKEFIEYAKARPDEVFYGMAGIGTSGHQHAEMFNQVTGLKLKGVNYKSAADAMTDIIGGRVHVMFVTTASSRGAVEAGQLRLLAYADSNLPPESLKAPTLAEAGVPNMQQAQTWWAIFGPPGLPADIKRKMNAAIIAAQKDPEFAALIARSGATPAPLSIDETIAVVREEVALVEKLPKMDP
jgi:tripartite-type tricarboxylate transporter receptor subunit TctC